jgi:hypothetical protein
MTLLMDAQTNNKKIRRRFMEHLSGDELYPFVNFAYV